MSDLKFIHKTNLPVMERKMMGLFELTDASFNKKNVKMKPLPHQPIKARFLQCLQMHHDFPKEIFKEQI